MKKKNGFISIASIYAFLVIFLLLMTMIILTYAHNRVNQQVYKNDLKKRYANVSLTIYSNNEGIVTAEFTPNCFYAITKTPLYPSAWSNSVASMHDFDTEFLDANQEYFIWAKNQEGYVTYKKFYISDSDCEEAVNYNTETCDETDEKCVTKNIYRTREIEDEEIGVEKCSLNYIQTNEYKNNIMLYNYKCFYNDEKLIYETKNGEICLNKYMGFIKNKEQIVNSFTAEKNVYDCIKYKKWSDYSFENPDTNLYCNKCIESITGYCYKGRRVIIDEE